MNIRWWINNLSEIIRIRILHKTIEMKVESIAFKPEPWMSDWIEMRERCIREIANAYNLTGVRVPPPAPVPGEDGGA